MSLNLVHCCVAGSKMLPIALPTKFGLVHSCPPATSTRPSARTVWPEQNKSRTSCCVSLGTAVNVFVVGSQTVAEIAPMQSGPPSQSRIFPVLSKTMFIGTTGVPLIGLAGMSITELHWPSGAVPLLTLTETDALAVLPALSRARAVRV